jgi:hypothetical protein
VTLVQIIGTATTEPHSKGFSGVTDTATSNHHTMGLSLLIHKCRLYVISTNYDTVAAGFTSFLQTKMERDGGFFSEYI